VASFGSFTKASYSAPQDVKNALGYPAYLLEGLKSIGDHHSYTIKLKTKDMELEDEFIFGGVSNSTSMGGILKLSESDVDLSDGLFEVMFIKKPQNIIQIQKLLMGIATRNYEIDQIVRFKTDHIIIHSDTSIAWTVDGEFGGVNTQVDIKNYHHAVKIIKPRRNGKEKVKDNALN
jgi:diacylglycerol kinase family enzyme